MLLLGARTTADNTSTRQPGCRLAGHEVQYDDVGDCYDDGGGGLGDDVVASYIGASCCEYLIHTLLRLYIYMYTIDLYI